MRSIERLSGAHRRTGVIAAAIVGLATVPEQASADWSTIVASPPGPRTRP